MTTPNCDDCDDTGEVQVPDRDCQPQEDPQTIPFSLAYCWCEAGEVKAQTDFIEAGWAAAKRQRKAVDILMEM